MTWVLSTNACAETNPTSSLFSVSQGVSLGGAVIDGVKTDSGTESALMLGVMPTGRKGFSRRGEPEEVLGACPGGHYFGTCSKILPRKERSWQIKAS